MLSSKGEALQVRRLLLQPFAISSCALESYFAAKVSDFEIAPCLNPFPFLAASFDHMRVEFDPLLLSLLFTPDSCIGPAIGFMP